MKPFHKILFSSSLIVLFPFQTMAVTFALASNSGAEIIVDSAPGLGKNAYLLKYTGIKSRWSDKVIKIHQYRTSNSDRYFFDYELDLSSGKEPRTYNILVENGKTLVSGSIVKKFDLFLPEGKGKAYEFFESTAVANKEKNTDLLKEYKKAPFAPDVD